MLVHKIEISDIITEVSLAAKTTQALQCIGERTQSLSALSSDCGEWSRKDILKSARGAK